MSAVAENTADGGAEAASPNAKRSKKKLILLAAPILLAVVGAGLWFSGILPGLLGKDSRPAAEAADKAKPPVFFELPEMVANLNVGARKVSFVKLKARLELSAAEDAAAAQAALPRLQDMFQTYLREMRPDELRGAGGTWRLREELIGRANLAIAPGHVVDVLFIEMLVQ